MTHQSTSESENHNHTIIDVDIAIFSYNRGVWLEHLLWSIKKCLSAEISPAIHIFDDSSSDKNTLRVLELAKANGIQVWNTQEFTSIRRGSRGGLHTGIKTALLDICRTSCMAVLLQDDMQIVRSVDINDIAHFKRIAREAGNPFVYANFWTGGHSYRNLTMLKEEGRDYFKKLSPREKRFRAYTDVAIVDVDMLRKSGLSFYASEKAIDHEAFMRFGAMAWSPYPFTAMLPEPDIYQRGEKTHGRLHKIKILNEIERWNFLNRDITKHLPVAEEYLDLEEHWIEKPWTYGERISLWQSLMKEISTKVSFSRQIK